MDRAGSELPAPYQRGFQVHGPVQGWAALTAPAEPSFAAQRRAERSQVRGDGAECVWRAGAYVSASAGRGGKPVRPARFPTAPGTACKTPASAAASYSQAMEREPRLWEHRKSGPGDEQHPGHWGPFTTLKALLLLCVPTRHLSCSIRGRGRDAQPCSTQLNHPVNPR